jgi:predicted Zn-dependent protease
MDLSDHALALGENLGADEIEVVWVKNVNTTVEAELGQICTASKIRNEGLRIRVIKNKALGSSFTYRMDKNSIEKAVKNALNAAQISRRDEYWDSLPSPGKYPHVDTWDPTLADISPEYLMDPVSEILQAFPDDIVVHFAGNEVTLKERRCINSHGITHEDKGTMGRYGIMAVGMLEDSVTPGFQEVQHLKTYDPDPQKAAESIVKKITLFKNRDTASSTIPSSRHYQGRMYSGGSHYWLEEKARK